MEYLKKKKTYYDLIYFKVEPRPAPVERLHSQNKHCNDKKIRILHQFTSFWPKENDTNAFLSQNDVL